MSTIAEKIVVTCPQCHKKLNVPPDSLGKKARCPSCSNLFALEASIDAQFASASQALAQFDSCKAPLAGIQPPEPLAPQWSTAPTVPLSSPCPAPSAQATTSSGKYQHGFGWEHRGWDKGVLGGLAMMGIAAVWFVAGLACGILFYYPPILFVIGLVGCIRGLVTGNLAGK